jgi:MinD superfamily P-loop ATPase
MKQLVTLSGKGGTGKTTITAALAQLASKETSLVLADADVDAANLELLLSPIREEQHDFFAGQAASIDDELCAGCGTCESLCRFDAVLPPPEPSDAIAYRIDRTACEGCAACMYACPTDAIRMEARQAGVWYRSETRFGPLFHAHMFAGQENSGKLVTLVKEKARQLAAETDRPLLLVDGPPGIGCPVISTLSGADWALIVTEPTVSAVHDLQRILRTAEHFGVQSLVVINKVDINPSLAGTVEDISRAQGIEVAGRIPYDNDFTDAMVQGLPVTAICGAELTANLQSIWEAMRKRLSATKPVSV